MHPTEISLTSEGRTFFLYPYENRTLVYLLEQKTVYKIHVVYLTKDIITEKILGAKIRSALGVNPLTRTPKDMFSRCVFKIVFSLSISLQKNFRIKIN